MKPLYQTFVFPVVCASGNFNLYAKFNSFYWCKFVIQILTFSDLDNKDKNLLFSRQTNWILACFLKVLWGQHFIWVVQRWYFVSYKNTALTLHSTGSNTYSYCWLDEKLYKVMGSLRILISYKHKTPSKCKSIKL